MMTITKTMWDISAITGIIVIAVIVIVALKHGVALTIRFGLTSGLTVLLIFVIIPLWFLNIPIKGKIIASVAGIVAGVANYLLLMAAIRKISRK
ncbi:MAG: hypothetical protein HZA22_04310 [Nitrospirae bacterium]|nr:hypothetical protein [Nitrospirota bacterium]MBI5694960.1 hypothetical protein [Nitrospirota bacterium]